MAVSILELPKKVVANLRDIARDIFDTIEANDPGVLPAVTRINYQTDLKGVGLDLDISNAAAAAGPATITIDKTKVVTLAAGTRFTLENVLFSLIEIRRSGAAAITVSAYHAGISIEALAKCR